MEIHILDSAFDPYQAISRYQLTHLPAGQYGASTHFIGTMRNYNEGHVIHAMYLEHYPEMARRHLEQIARTAQSRWDLLDLLIMHRTGALQPGEPIVLVAVWSGHRRPAFEACRFIIEDLKSRAPFWKKERTPEGEYWLQKNTAP